MVHDSHLRQRLNAVLLGVEHDLGRYPWERAVDRVELRLVQVEVGRVGYLDVVETLPVLVNLPGPVRHRSTDGPH